MNCRLKDGSIGCRRRLNHANGTIFDYEKNYFNFIWLVHNRHFVFQGIFLNVDELAESNRRFNARLKDAVEVSTAEEYRADGVDGPQEMERN